MRLALSLLILLTLSGCSTLSKKECLQGDWYGIGLNDGINGYGQERMDEHRESCAEHGQSVDHAAYQRGRSEGLKQFCTQANGYQQGSNGREYNDVCPTALKMEFLEGYHSGLQGALERAEQALEHAKWQYMAQIRQSPRRERDKEKEGDRDRKRDNSADHYKYEVERRQREVESLQKLLDEANFLLRQHGDRPKRR
jgi:hypothetical protein